MNKDKILQGEIVEEVYIRDYENFSIVDNSYYGGNQAWLSDSMFTTKFWADRSCGVVAGANIASYKSKESNLPSLYPYKSRSKKDFTKHIYDLYKFINPAFYGVPTINNMVKGFVKYGKSRGLVFKPMYFKGKWNLENIIIYIKSGLRENNPVLLLTWNTPLRGLRNHWVTITGLIRTKDGRTHIITSNWGKMETYSLDDWFNNPSLYKGLIYFRVGSQDEFIKEE